MGGPDCTAGSGLVCLVTCAAIIALQHIGPQTGEYLRDGLPVHDAIISTAALEAVPRTTEAAEKIQWAVTGPKFLGH
jgi:hypothetical protein